MLPSNQGDIKNVALEAGRHQIHNPPDSLDLRCESATYPQGDQPEPTRPPEGGPQSQPQHSRTPPGSNSEIATTQTLTIDDVDSSNGGTYTCTVTINGMSASSNLTVYSKCT